MKSVFVLSVLLAVGYGASVPRESQGDCRQFCPEVSSPLCASDGNEFRTFPNDCELDAFNCWETRDFQPLRAGACEEEEEEPAEAVRTLPEDLTKEKMCKPCTRIYVPVCGFNGIEQRVFGSECEMEFINCVESQDFYMLKDGEC